MLQVYSHKRPVISHSYKRHIWTQITLYNAVLNSSAPFVCIYRASFPQLHPFSGILAFSFPCYLPQNSSFSLHVLEDKIYLAISGLHKMVDVVLLQSSTCGGWWFGWRRRNVHLCSAGASSWQGKKKWVGGPYVSEQSLFQFLLAGRCNFLQRTPSWTKASVINMLTIFLTSISCYLLFS